MIAPLIIGAITAFVIAILVSSGESSMGAGSMLGKLSSDEIRQYASAAGFTGTDLDTAVAIALAESSGDPAALGDVALGGSLGLWQVYTVAHPDFAAQDLTDPQTNANAAFAIYQAAGNSFHPWTTYKTGAYKKYLAPQGGAGGSF